ncbi:MAG: MarR family transcriptional regulator [Actinomycetota bacterium]|nr:MarR family transcriptional regulator [Actinomycetota bacterium]
MSLADRIVEKLRVQARALDDDELAAHLGVIRQAVNQACRGLEQKGIVERYVGPNNKIVNRLRSSEAREVVAAPPASASARPHDRTLISEDEVKEAVKAHLEAQSFEVTVAWGRTRGADIVATRPGARWVLEAKGEVLLQPQQVNYFLGALGELVQRMDDPDTTYGLALPDNRQYRGLVSRLPSFARHRLGLRVFFVSRSFGRLEVTEG